MNDDIKPVATLLPTTELKWHKPILSFPPNTDFYPAAALKAAKVQVLREIVNHGLEGLCSEAGMRFILAKADELERSEG
jgi:hypothetical protein